MPAMPAPQMTTSAVCLLIRALDCNTWGHRSPHLGGTSLAYSGALARSGGRRMPIPEDVEPGTPRADTRLLEFIERRRQQDVRDRRQRLQLAAIACLGVIVLILTISNAFLVSRRHARPPVPPALAPQPTVRPAPPTTPPSPAVSEPSASPSPARGTAAALRPTATAAAPIADAPPPAALEPDDAPTLPERKVRISSDGRPNMVPKPPDVRSTPAQLGRRRPRRGGGTAAPGRCERVGVWGPLRGPHDANHSREAPRLRRGAANAWGSGGHFGARTTLTTPEKRHGCAGALRTRGGLGAISGPARR